MTALTKQDQLITISLAIWYTTGKIWDLERTQLTLPLTTWTSSITVKSCRKTQASTPFKDKRIRTIRGSRTSLTCWIKRPRVKASYPPHLSLQWELIRAKIATKRTISIKQLLGQPTILSITIHKKEIWGTIIITKRLSSNNSHTRLYSSQRCIQTTQMTNTINRTFWISFCWKTTKMLEIHIYSSKRRNSSSSAMLPETNIIRLSTTRKEAQTSFKAYFKLVSRHQL